jgi:hypothetical protein
MKCIFCEKLVFGASGMSLGNLGVAHQQCFSADEALKRTFQNLDIRALNDQELVELKDLVLTEENARRPPGDVDEIELF